MRLATPEAILGHWEGHRRLTLRVVDAFPEDALFGYAPAEPLRTFGRMAAEIAAVEASLVRTLLAGEWRFEEPLDVADKAELLELLRSVREETRRAWPDLDPDALRRAGPAPIPTPLAPFEDFSYMIDNEIHHRAQGYVYLRLLGLEPPPFYER